MPLEQVVASKGLTGAESFHLRKRKSPFDYLMYREPLRVLEWAVDRQTLSPADLTLGPWFRTLNEGVRETLGLPQLRLDSTRANSKVTAYAYLWTHMLPWYGKSTHPAGLTCPFLRDQACFLALLVCGTMCRFPQVLRGGGEAVAK